MHRVAHRITSKTATNQNGQDQNGHKSVNTDYIPSNFVVDDVVIDQQRHLLFATPLQLQLLARAETWYVDGTFKVVKSPFAQLLSVHGFVRRDGAVKQIPLSGNVITGTYTLHSADVDWIVSVNVMNSIIE